MGQAHSTQGSSNRSFDTTASSIANAATGRETNDVATDTAANGCGGADVERTSGGTVTFTGSISDYSVSTLEYSSLVLRSHIMASKTMQSETNKLKDHILELSLENSFQENRDGEEEDSSETVEGGVEIGESQPPEESKE